MKLSFQDTFTIEYEDKTYIGEFLELTRKQTKELSNKYKDNKDDEQDAVYKARLELSIVSDDKAEIMRLGEKFNFKAIFDVIIRSIGEVKEGN